MFKIFYKNCCGLDVHKTWIYACIGITDTAGITSYHEALFSSFSRGLRGLAGWLQKYEFKLVCMESTGPMTAITILSEIGSDMSVFPSSKNLISWAGCCPRNDQSAKHVKSTRISRAGAWIKPLLVQISNALIHSKKYPEFSERYRRIKARRGHRKAIIDPLIRRKRCQRQKL